MSVATVRVVPASYKNKSKGKLKKKVSEMNSTLPFEEDALLLDAGGNEGGSSSSGTKRWWFAFATASLIISAATIISAAAVDGGVGVDDVRSYRHARTAMVDNRYLGAQLGSGTNGADEDVDAKDLRLKKKRAQLGDVPLDPNHLQSMHSSDGGPPTIYVADADDPAGGSGFESLKAEVVALVDAPQVVGRMELVPGVLATDLPVKIELLEEATSPLKDGLATVTGTYVDKKHEYGVANGAVGKAFFNLDEGKKMVVRRGELESKVPALGIYLRDVHIRSRGGVAAKLGLDPESNRDRDDPNAELSELEKKALGTRVGASMSHLLAWTRAKKSGKKLALIMETTFNIAGLKKKKVKKEDEEGIMVGGKDFQSVLEAITAYHPEDADVVFLDKSVGGVAMLGKPAMKLQKTGKWERDVHFVPAVASELGAGFYLVTEKFLDKAYSLIEKSGFHFVDEWLVRHCATYGNLKCYQTTPALGRFAKSKAAFPVLSEEEDRDGEEGQSSSSAVKNAASSPSARDDAAAAGEAEQRKVTSIDDLFADADATVSNEISLQSDVEVDAAFGGERLASSTTAATAASLGKSPRAKDTSEKEVDSAKKVEEEGGNTGNPLETAAGVKGSDERDSENETRDMKEEKRQQSGSENDLWGGSPLWAKQEDSNSDDAVDDILVDRTIAKIASLGEAQPDFQLPNW